MNTLLVWLDPAPGIALRLLRLDGDGRLLSSQSLPADAPVAVEPGTRVWLLVPGQWVRSDWLPLPDSHPAQMRAAAALQLQEQLAAPLTDTHIALATHADGEHRLVASCSSTRLQDWLARARALGLHPDGVLPDALALPLPETDAASETVMLATLGGHLLARGRHLAIRGRDALVTPFLEGRPHHALASEDAIDAAIASGMRDPAINLMQFEFAATHGRRGRGWRLHLWLAAALLLSPLLLKGVDTLQYRQATQGLQAQDQARIDQALPGRPGSYAPQPWLRHHLQQARLGALLPTLLKHLDDALSRAGDTRAEVLHFDAEGQLTATLDHLGPSELQQVIAHLQAAGLQAEAVGSRPEGARLRSEILVRPMETRP